VFGLRKLGDVVASGLKGGERRPGSTTGSSNGRFPPVALRAHQTQEFGGVNLANIAEMLGYSRVITLSSAKQSTADRQKSEGYLAWKWGLTGNLSSSHPYKFAAP
jgi:hypothetical protein